MNLARYLRSALLFVSTVGAQMLAAPTLPGEWSTKEWALRFVVAAAAAGAGWITAGQMNASPDQLATQLQTAGYKVEKAP